MLMDTFSAIDLNASGCSKGIEVSLYNKTKGLVQSSTASFPNTAYCTSPPRYGCTLQLHTFVMVNE
jgi:hypothetical protein